MGNRQDSLTDQLRDLHGIAVERGMYDAADWLKSRLPRSPAEIAADREWAAAMRARGIDVADNGMRPRLTPPF